MMFNALVIFSKTMESNPNIEWGIKKMFHLFDGILHGQFFKKSYAFNGFIVTHYDLNIGEKYAAEKHWKHLNVNSGNIWQ